MWCKKDIYSIVNLLKHNTESSLRYFKVIKMEATESPLEVLSRAATMLQQNQETLASTEDTSKEATNSKHLPTTKWKRERRNRLPEYSRKSDPKITETFGTIDRQGSASPEDSGSMNGHQENCNGKTSTSLGDAPLDMSVRQRGLPPSYSQTINNPGYRSNYKPSAANNGVPPAREELPSGMSMCDPIIDEHFRRSLGNDYQTLFSNNNVAKEVPAPVKPPPPVLPQLPTKNVIELMDNSGMSVDDHFAKALGDTWVKLNKKEQDLKNNSNDNHSLLSI